jgi:hypothetical protein
VKGMDTQEWRLTRAYRWNKVRLDNELRTGRANKSSPVNYIEIAPMNPL